MNYCPRCFQRFPEGAFCPLDGGALCHLDDPRLGLLLCGSYRVLERIGAGGMATIYRARHEPLRRDVALKILSPALSLEPTQRARFLREGRAMEGLKHPNIVAVYDVRDEGSDVFLALELLQGISLAERLVRGKLPPREAVRYARSVAEALAHAHDAGVVHRDIKPENLFLAARPDGAVTVKVLDFGLALLPSETRLTSLGSVVGTPEYLSPEMARGHDSVPASDLYALGVVLFEMLLGRLPFEGPAAEVIVQHATAAPPALGEAFPPALDALVQTLLAKLPAARPRDAWHLVRSLGALLPQLPEEPDGGFRLRPFVAQVAPEGSGLERRAREALEGALGAPSDTVSAVEIALRDAEDKSDTLAQEAQELARREAWHDDAMHRLSHALEDLGLEEAQLTSEQAQDILCLHAQRERLAEALNAVGRSPEANQAHDLATAWVALQDDTARLRDRLRDRRCALEDLSAQRSVLRQRLRVHEEARDHELHALRLSISAHGAALELARAALAEHLAALRRASDPPDDGQGTVPFPKERD